MMVPDRVRWAVETLAIRPDDHLLEIGCGRGVAVALICERLAGGRITAIDRSATMIRVAEQHNAANIAAGKAVLRIAALDAVEPDGERFDKVFAINVNLFWVRSPAKELALIRPLLAPRGALYLCYEPPSAAKARELVRTLPAVLTEHGFATTTSTAGATLLCVRARPRLPARGKA